MGPDHEGKGNKTNSRVLILHITLYRNFGQKTHPHYDMTLQYIRIHIFIYLNIMKVLFPFKSPLGPRVFFCQSWRGHNWREPYTYFLMQ